MDPSLSSSSTEDVSHLSSSRDDVKYLGSAQQIGMDGSADEGSLGSPTVGSCPIPQENESDLMGNEIIRVKNPRGTGEDEEKMIKYAAVCLSCFKEFNAADNVLKTKCKCKFTLIHEDCIAKWSATNGCKCTNCKQQIDYIPIALSENPTSSKSPKSPSTSTVASIEDLPFGMPAPYEGELVVNEYIRFKVKNPQGTGEVEEKMIKYEAVCISCFEELNAAYNVRKTKCECKFALIHEDCIAKLCATNDSKCTNCEKQIDYIPIKLSENPTSSKSPKSPSTSTVARIPNASKDKKKTNRCCC